MIDVSRRQILQSGGAAGLLLLPGGAARAAPTWNGPPPEPGASIRVLRWKQFIQAEFDAFVENTKKFAQQTGQPCGYCHSKPPALNDQGKKFKANGNKL